MKACKIVPGERIQHDVPQDPPDIMMGITAAPGGISLPYAVRVIIPLRIPLQIRGSHDQQRPLSGSDIICNIAVPGCKASGMASDEMPSDPAARAAVYSLEPQHDPLSLIILRDLDIPSVIIFRVIFYIKSLHGQLTGNTNRSPAVRLPDLWIHILVL